MKRQIAVRYGCSEEKTAADILSVRLNERGVQTGEGCAEGYNVIFKLDKGLAPGAFRFDDAKCKTAAEGLEISAAGLIGLLHGAGHFLRGCAFQGDGLVVPEFRGVSEPKCEVRGIYFASHFHNFYHVAEIDELRRYLEDLALWGMNYLLIIYPMIDLTSVDDPESAFQLKRIAEVCNTAHSVGIKVATSLTVNGGFKDYPKQWKAAKNYDPLGRRGDAGNHMCLSIPGVQELMDEYNEFLCKGLKQHGAEPDLFCCSAYDEGGCGCSSCAPWGAKGFIKGAKRAFEIAQKYFPNAQRFVSTWMFDTPYEGEYEALSHSLEKDKWCDFILSDAHEDFPRYPLDVGVPGGLPLLNFPEISMWGLHPWGAWGATMLPERFVGLFNQVKDKLSGGFCYSEGLYEDVNKALVLQFYWTGKTDWKDILRKYARYELGLSETELFIDLVSLIEKTHTEVATKKHCNLADSDEAFRLAEEIDKALPEWGKSSWRWRIIYLRALIDSRRYRIAKENKEDKIEIGNEHRLPLTDWKRLLSDDKQIQAAFRELIKIFKCMERASDDPYHHRVRPVCD